MGKDLKVDFLHPHPDRVARRTTILIAAGFTLLVGLLSAVGAGASFRSVTHGTNVLFEVSNLPIIADMRQLVLGSQNHGKDLAGADDGRLSILIFGVGGAGHGGPELTDTIILATADLNNKRVSLLSIPRDLAYPLDGGRFQKINAVNAYAEEAHPGVGAKIAAQSIGELLQVKIDHAIKIDFNGFEKFVDALGGLNINVERSFTDYSFPTVDDEWQTVGFAAGPQVMNGARALQFVRSRHGTGGEGGDFARSERQQKVMTAVAGKLLSLGTLGNPNKIAELWGVVSSHIQTDLSIWDTVKLAQLASSLDSQNSSLRVLTDDPNSGELVSANVDGAFMLFPKKPDWSEIRTIANNPFETKEEIAARLRPAQEIKLEIKNGTTRDGLAAQISADLQDNGYTITQVSNATQRGYEHTVIFDLTGGTKLTELARLKRLLNANVSTMGLAATADAQPLKVFSPGMTEENVDATTTDFLIILGESSLGMADGYQ
jgi:LCP family protein required for cell wall assembly